MTNNMGIYTKAFYLKEFRRFSEWRENEQNARPENDEDKPRKLEDNSVLYLQDNFIVTDGIFKDEYIIFENVNEQWVDFCKNELKFAIPDEVKAAQAAAEEALQKHKEQAAASEEENA